MSFIKYNFTIIILICFMTNNCKRDLPPLKTLDVALIPENQSQIRFKFNAPQRNPSEGYWKYKIALVPLFDSNPPNGYFIVNNISKNNSKKYDIKSYTRSSWNSPKSSYLINITDEIFIDNNLYEISFVFEESRHYETKILIHYLSY